MRFVWTDAGDDPSWDVGDRHGIDGYFAPLFDPITEAVVLEAGRRGHAQGVYFGHNWRPGASPEQIVAEVNSAFHKLVAKAPRLRLMWNLEEQDPDFVADVLEEWRRVRPKTNTSWSPAGMQGGWMDPGFVARVLACKVRVVPQAYLNEPNMNRVESDVVLRDVTRRGFPEHIVSIFYDAAQLGSRWDGYAYTMGRLP